MYETWLPVDVKNRCGGAGKRTCQVIDVRERAEWHTGHIPKANHIPLGELPMRLRELDAKLLTIVVCQSGGRSARACEYLSQQGYRAVNMLGGMSQWHGDVSYT